MVLLTDNPISDLLAIAATVFIAFYAYFQWCYQYWEKKGCPYLPPKFPTGTSSTFIRKTTNFTLETVKFYEEIKKRGLKFAGLYILARPVLVVIDPEYVKDILSKDFQYFIDRGFYYNEKDDPVSAHLFALDGTKWKNMRTKLTPTFTSGKMKMMFQTIMDCSKGMIDAIEAKANDRTDIDIRGYLASFTTDVIGSCAFGLECNSFKDPDSAFRQMADNIFQYRGIKRTWELMMISKLPSLALKLGLKAIYPEVSDFFRSVVHKTVAYRENNNVKRPDFLQLLIDLKNASKGTNDPFTNDQLAAQVFLFFLAGFDTSSTTMTFALYQLSRYPDIQERTRKEILEVLDKQGGKLTYETLGEMKYLQQVIDESQRIVPPVLNLTRRCVKDYTLRDTNISIDEGTTVVIPLYSLQHDPDHFPEPEKFDPDRFSPENKSSRHPYTHLPFGEGPRNCIGLRFGLMQSKIGLIEILRRFRLRISPSTKMPLEIDRQVFLAKSTETLYITAEKL